MSGLSRGRLLCLALLAGAAFAADSQPSNQVQIAPPKRQIQPPAKDASAEELEKEGDQLRSRKEYPDAIDYFRAALVKAPQSASLYNKIGISYLMLERPKEAGRQFEQAIKRDRNFSDAYNNLGVSDY